MLPCNESFTLAINIAQKTMSEKLPLSHWHESFGKCEFNNKIRADSLNIRYASKFLTKVENAAGPFKRLFNSGIRRQVAVASFRSESRHLSLESRVMNREACVEVSKKDSDSNAAR